VSAALGARRDRPDTFLVGGYLPVLAYGEAGEHLIAYLRGEDVLVAVSRWTVRLAQTGWGETVLPLPEGNWTDRITRSAWAGAVPAAELFADLPVALLERAHG
ncbi:MAG TPA: malto-oligosyltrehalose synthase, partial [Mycobacterium sp.]|nr:malto-oligosyltrehalose synthase [Mycobacterium sp.]